jgi:hypothetical protein
MKARDRIVLIALATVAVLVAVWIMAVSPERKKANQIVGEVSTAQSQLQSAESQLASASAARAKYQTAYASIVGLGKAVPADQEVPSLIYELSQATNEKNVEFASITSGGSSGGSSSSSSSSSSAGAAAASAGFTQMPFTFVFNGTFTNLYNLFNELDGYAQRTTAGQVQVSGRLLTVQSVQLTPNASSGSGSSSSGKSKEELTGSISATAYVLPAGQSVTGGATAAGPASDETAGAERKASSAAGTSSNAPAVVEANP